MSRSVDEARAWAALAEKNAEIERLRSIIAWMENLDPQLVEAALAYFPAVTSEDRGGGA